MSTVRITTNVTPATVNKLRMALYKASAPTAVVDSLEQDWQTENIWTFYDIIPAINYIYNLFEVDANGAILQQFTNSPNFTAQSAGSISVKTPVDVEVGVTAGVFQNTNSHTFADWISWDITVEEVGKGTMKRGEEYSYDITTGAFTLLGTGHVFNQGQRYFVRFEPKVIAGSGVISKDLWDDVRVITTDTVLTADDFGKKILIAGTGSYLNITLPDFASVPKNRMLYVESAPGNHINATIISANANAINWLEGNRTKLYIGRSEAIDIYAGPASWRVHRADGNFKTVGRFFYSDKDSDKEDNAVEAMGLVLNNKEYSRLYFDFVLKQGAASLVNYSDWLTGNFGRNIFKFSYADASGFFRVPDLRGYHLFNAGAGYNPGDFIEQSMLDFRVHTISEIDVDAPFPTKTTSVARSSAHGKGNQDYDLSQTVTVPTSGISGPPVDVFGNPIKVGTRIMTSSIATRIFINT